MKILHTSDLHLKQYGDERWDALLNLLEIGKQEAIDLLIISGDLFDKNYNAEQLRSELRAPFSNNSFKIVIIPGNHDVDSYTDGYVFGNDVEIIRNLEKPLIYNNVAIWGLPFEFIDSQQVFSRLFSIKEELKEYDTNILLFHGDLIDAMFLGNETGEEGDRQYMPVKLSFFKDLGIDYILAGHIHSNFGVWQPDEGKYFVYPGSPISITKKETGPRKVNLFECGEPPQEYLLRTPYYENVPIDFDPLNDLNPILKIQETVKDIPSHAKICLNLDGFVNSEEIGLSEKGLKEKIEEIFESECFDVSIKFQDVNVILQDDLFIKFSKKLEERGLDEEEAKQIKEIVINSLLRLNR
ncbi:MAG: metallophosphoesterase [Candidatus Lokiarchaeota archaeon]